MAREDVTRTGGLRDKVEELYKKEKKLEEKISKEEYKKLKEEIKEEVEKLLKKYKISTTQEQKENLAKGLTEKLLYTPKSITKGGWVHPIARLKRKAGGETYMERLGEAFAIIAEQLKAKGYEEIIPEKIQENIAKVAKLGFYDFMMDVLYSEKIIPSRHAEYYKGTIRKKAKRGVEEILYETKREVAAGAIVCISGITLVTLASKARLTSMATLTTATNAGIGLGILLVLIGLLIALRVKLARRARRARVVEVKAKARPRKKKPRKR